MQEAETTLSAVTLSFGNMSLNCIFCKKPVFGPNGLTVPKRGPAHRQCYQADAALRRTFQSLDITELNDDELLDLKDLVLTEENERCRQLAGEAEGSGDVELF